MGSVGEAFGSRAELKARGLRRYAFGKCLREIRSKRKVTLKELSRRTGLSTGALSLIENGFVTPTIETLVKLVRSLGITLSYIMESLEREEGNVCEVIKRENLPTFRPARSHHFLRRVSGKGPGRMDSVVVESHQGRAWELPESFHEGEEFVYILNGTVQVSMGDRVLQLNEGDSLYFDAKFRHKFRGEPGSKMLVVFTLY